MPRISRNATKVALCKRLGILQRQMRSSHIPTFYQFVHIRCVCDRVQNDGLSWRLLSWFHCSRPELLNTCLRYFPLVVRFSELLWDDKVPKHADLVVEGHRPAAHGALSLRRGQGQKVVYVSKNECHLPLSILMVLLESNTASAAVRRQQVIQTSRERFDSGG